MALPSSYNQIRAAAPVLSFLAPSLRRPFSSTRSSFNHQQETARRLKNAKEAATKPGSLNKPLTQAQRDFLSSAVRFLSNISATL